MINMDKLNEILAQTLIALQDKELIETVRMGNMRIEVYRITENSEIGKIGTLLLKGFKNPEDKFAKDYSFAKEGSLKEQVDKLFKKMKEK